MRRYAELHCKTNFSFLQGASHADELVTRAVELGYHALAITDQNSLAGVVRAHAAAKPAGLKLLIGAEITPLDAPPVLLYALNHAGYRNLARLITRGRRAAKKGECQLVLEDIVEHADHLLAAVLFIDDQVDKARSRSGIRKNSGASPGIGILANSATINFLSALATGSPLNYADIFRGRCYLAAAAHRGADDESTLARLAQRARKLRLPLIATNDVYYHDPARRPLHDVLTAVRHHTTVAELGERRFPNGERYLKAPAQMAELFARYPQALINTVELADRCSFSLDELRYEYPEELCPPGLSPTEHLAELTWAGARERYPAGIPPKVAVLIERELALIAELHYEAYFLTVWDLVKYARARNILCQGRGSAANSAVCYCLGITSVDPDRTDLLFERFISRERAEAPDIDVDFEHERREEVLQYVYQKYGRDRAGIVAEVITYQPRSAVRDVGKALGLSLDAVDRFAKVLDAYAEPGNIPERIHEAGLDPHSTGAVQLVQLSTELLGFPRHLSQHVGGFVITRGLLSELVPIENAAMPERTFIEWDKDDLDTLGILKVDCLSLGMLTAIHKCFDLVAKHDGRELTLATVPAEDPDVYEMICQADTIGVFQIESRAQMSMLPRLMPRCFYDLVVEVAIVRPGPIQGGMVHPYLRRRNGEEPVTYPSPAVEEVLSKTLGVPLFQEQVMRLAMVAAGFTAGEADQLRRAMGGWRRPGIIDKFRAKLRDGMLAQGLPLDFAERLFEQVRGFGEYGFPESHAASFALLAYVSAWLKYHYPAAFTAAILNSLPMGFYAPAQLVRDAQEHGVAVQPVGINHSAWDCMLEPAIDDEIVNGFKPARESSSVRGRALPRTLEDSRAGLKPSLRMRLGFRLIKGFPEATAPAIVAARAERPFRSILDVARRGQVSRALLARLAAADAFGALGLGRRAALWQVLALGEELPLFIDLDQEDEPSPPLTDMTLENHVIADYNSIGLSLKAHPMSLVRKELEALRVVPATALDTMANKAMVRVAGLVLVRQKPATASGTIFMTIEDETGTVNLILWPRVWERFRHAVRSAVAVLVQGRIDRAGKVIHVAPTLMEDLSQSLRGLAAKSRDFH